MAKKKVVKKKAEEIKVTPVIEYRCNICRTVNTTKDCCGTQDCIKVL